LILIIIFKTIKPHSTSPFCGRKAPQKGDTAPQNRGKQVDTCFKFPKASQYACNFLWKKYQPQSFSLSTSARAKKRGELKRKEFGRGLG